MNLEAIRTLRLDPIRHSYTARDSILYALGLGFGDRPADPAQLQFLYEKAPLKAVPSICVVLAHPGFWVSRPELGIDWIRILHGEQGCDILAPIPPEGVVRGEYEVLAVEDKGPDKGAVMHVAKRLYDDGSNTLMATVTSTYMLRGDAKAGFPRPILHGLCTFGIATRGLMEALADSDPARVRSISARFSRPVFPGETLRVEIFGNQGAVQFRARCVERDLIVLDRGMAHIAAAESGQ